MTPSGIEPATFRFVAQHLNHCATAVLNIKHRCRKIILLRCTRQKMDRQWAGQCRQYNDHKHYSSLQQKETEYKIKRLVESLYSTGDLAHCKWGRSQALRFVQVSLPQVSTAITWFKRMRCAA